MPSSFPVSAVLLQFSLLLVSLNGDHSSVDASRDRLEQAYLRLYNNHRHHVDFSALSRLLNDPGHRDGVDEAGLGGFAHFLTGKSPQNLERMTTAWQTGNAGRMLKVLGEKDLAKFDAHMRQFNAWVAEKRRGWVVVNRETGEVGTHRIH